MMPTEEDVARVLLRYFGDEGIEFHKQEDNTIWRRAMVNARAVLALFPPVPPGWKLVPVEATDAMYLAALRITRDPGFGHVADVTGGAVWRAMVAAAPSPPTKEPGHDE